MAPFATLQDKHVLVIGTQEPWIEVIALICGADHITTLEYAPLQSEHPQITTITPKQLGEFNHRNFDGSKCSEPNFKNMYFPDENYKNTGKLPKFDIMISYSSLEHSGLGRYTKTIINLIQ